MAAWRSIAVRWRSSGDRPLWAATPGSRPCAPPRESDCRRRRLRKLRRGVCVHLVGTPFVGPRSGWTGGNDMAFDLAAWVVIALVAGAIGNGVLVLLGADRLRRGDHLILAVWIGVVIGALALLATSLFTPLSPAVSATVAGTLAALGAAATR